MATVRGRKHLERRRALIADKLSELDLEDNRPHTPVCGSSGTPPRPYRELEIIRIISAWRASKRQGELYEQGRG
jgi:hypothetical protein